MFSVGIGKREFFAHQIFGFRNGTSRFGPENLAVLPVRFGDSICLLVFNVFVLFVFSCAFCGRSFPNFYSGGNRGVRKLLALEAC